MSNLDARKQRKANINKHKRNKFIKVFVKNNKLATVSFIILSIIILSAILAPIIAPHDPNQTNLSEITTKPNSTYILGTDSVGRDIFSRLLYGTRMSLLISVSGVAIAGVIGIFLGAISGYYGGFLDKILLRVAEIFLCFPAIILAMALISVLGPSIINLILLFGLLNWARLYRLTRAKFLSLREEESVEALRALAISDMSIMFRHMLSRSLGPIVVWITLSVATFIIAEAGLSFLGLGVQMPEASLGNLLSYAKNINILRNYPWLWIIPGVVISLITLCINFLGDGLRDAFDPRSNL